jgi:hypothetical protein
VGRSALRDHFSTAPAASLETTAAIIVIIAALLIAGHVKRTRPLDDVVLACAVSLFATTNLFLGVIACPGWVIARLRERAEAVGGQLRVRPPPGNGTDLGVAS